MISKVSCRTSQARQTTACRRIRNPELGRVLDEYEGFVRSKAWQYARRHEELADLQQVGREAVVEVFGAIEGGLRASSVKGYYLNSIQNAMLDYCRKEYRRNYEVWEYDKKNGPTRVKRYRYAGEWKARIQYHGDKLRRVALEHRKPLQFPEYF